MEFFTTAWAQFQTFPLNEQIAFGIFVFLLLIFTASASASRSKTINGKTYEVSKESYIPGRLIKMVFIVSAFFIPIWFVVVIFAFFIYYFITHINQFGWFLLIFQPSQDKLERKLVKIMR